MAEPTKLWYLTNLNRPHGVSESQRRAVEERSACAAALICVIPKGRSLRILGPTELGKPA